VFIHLFSFFFFALGPRALPFSFPPQDIPVGSGPLQAAIISPPPSPRLRTSLLSPPSRVAKTIKHSKAQANFCLLSFLSAPVPSLFFDLWKVSLFFFFLREFVAILIDFPSPLPRQKVLLSVARSFSESPFSRTDKKSRPFSLRGLLTHFFPLMSDFFTPRITFLDSFSYPTMVSS